MKARVVILGVAHSGQLVSESYQPGVFRAFYDRVQPAAIAVERSPEQFARNDHYEFTYEIQYLTIPYARDRGIPVFPFDWYPSLDDQMLGFGLDLEALPILRPAQGFQAFLTFLENDSLSRALFYSEATEHRERQRTWQDRPADPASLDLARRLFLYRTFMQARHIQRIANGYRGKTLLVVVGDQHKDDIESILAESSSIEIVQPSTIGAPQPESVAANITEADRYAIATFNLLGLQARLGPVDWEWLERVVGALHAAHSTPELELFGTRLSVLRGTIAPTPAADMFARIAERPGDDARFTWTGVKDDRRLDSYFDPFGNLRIDQRARLEQARELYKSGHKRGGDALKAELAIGLSPSHRPQLEGYWHDFVVRSR